MIKKLKEKNGFSELVNTIFGLIILLTMLIIILLFVTLFNKYTVLNEFGSQMVIAVSDYGKTDGENIQTKYDHLSKTLGIKPKAEYEAKYFDSSQNKVQYGDVITATFTSKENINFLGFKSEIDLVVKKTCTSRQYWK